MACPCRAQRTKEAVTSVNQNTDPLASQRAYDANHKPQPEPQPETVTASSR